MKICPIFSNSHDSDHPAQPVARYDGNRFFHDINRGEKDGKRIAELGD